MLDYERYWYAKIVDTGTFFLFYVKFSGRIKKTLSKNVSAEPAMCLRQFKTFFLILFSNLSGRSGIESGP